MGLANWPALWGFMGALIYAAPVLTACLYAHREGEPTHPIVRCWLEFSVAIATGTICAAAFSEPVAVRLGLDTQADLRAISALIGLTANRAAPLVIEALNGELIKRIRGS